MLGLHWWARNTSSTTSFGHGTGHDQGQVGGTTTCSTSDNNASSINCCGLSKLMRKLKKRSKMLKSGSRQSSFQCRYDPLSYSLNFDTSGSGGFLDEDYYRLYAFSSRFAATSRSDCHTLMATSH